MYIYLCKVKRAHLAPTYHLNACHQEKWPRSVLGLQQDPFHHSPQHCRRLRRLGERNRASRLHPAQQQDADVRHYAHSHQNSC